MLAASASGVELEQVATTLRLLLSYSAEIDAPNLEGQTALMLAAIHKRSRAVQVLLEAGASVESTDRTGHTALSLANERPTLTREQADWAGTRALLLAAKRRGPPSRLPKH